MNIHKRIKDRREQLEMSQGDLAAEVSRLEGLPKPFSYTAVQAWERQNEKATAPKLERLPYVAIALKCSISYLVTGDPVFGDPPDLPKDERIIVQHDPNKMTLHYCTPEEDSLLEMFRLAYEGEERKSILKAATAAKKRPGRSAGASGGAD